MLKNLGNGVFADVAMAIGADDIRDARAAAIADFDNDGDMDVVINNNPGIGETIKPVLYRNDIGDKLNWLEVELTGTSVNRDAVGSEVYIELADGSTQLRHIMLGSAYASQSSLRLHFGLADHKTVSKLTVKWKGPGAGTEVFKDIEANQIIKIVQGQGSIDSSFTARPPQPEPAVTPVTTTPNETGGE